MCGFAGIAWGDRFADGSREAIGRATAAIIHRGPDSEGVVASSFAHIGFRRLSIIDLEMGRQPMRNEDGSVEVFLNGEIFNHLVLRRRLEAEGHHLLTRSDTEVLPHLWEDFGPGMLKHLNGMFAICVVDHRSRQVFLARDRIGIKPLFFADTARGVVFASELKAMLASGLVGRDLAQGEVVRLLDTLTTGGRHTLINGVDRVLPGESLRIDPDGRPHLERWYDLATELGQDPGPSAPTDVIDLLTDSVSLRLNADVPVGISLSGGIDSTLLALLAHRSGHRGVKAFTVDFAEAPPTERQSATAVADALGIEHTVIDATTADYLDAAPFSVWTSDEPIADPAFYPALKVAEAASRDVTVLLAGSGADELFAGYGHHRMTRKGRAVMCLPRFTHGVVRSQGRRFGIPPEAVAAMSSYQLDRSGWHALAMTHLSVAERTMLMREIEDSADPLEPLHTAFSRIGSSGTLTGQLFADTVTYLPDQLLPLLDRTTMAHSVEGRVPFLDHRVVEAALRLPDRYKLGPDGATKLLLRDTLRGHVPDIVLNRPKLGFPNAVQTWLSGGLGDLVPVMLADPDGLARQVLPHAWVASLTASRQAMLNRWPVVNALVTLQLWHRLFVLDRMVTPPRMSLGDLYPAPRRRFAS